VISICGHPLPGRRNMTPRAIPTPEP